MNDLTQNPEIVEQAPSSLELRDIATADLHNQLNDAIGMTETAVKRVAILWRELTRRGEDMSRYRFAMAQFMPAVADGRLIPKLVVSLAGQPRALSRLAELPVNDQQSLVSGSTVEVYRGGDLSEAKTLDDMTWSEIALVIRDGHIRSVAEQKLASERSKNIKRKTRAGRPPRISVKPDGMLKIGAAEVEIERVLAELRAAGIIQ